MFMSTTETVIKNITNIEEITSFQSQYHYGDALLDKISVEEDYRLNVDGELLGITDTGMQSYCKLLDIPYKFGTKIPNDLLQKNVDRLKQPIRVKMVKRDNNIVNMIDSEKLPNFRVLDTGLLLDYFGGGNFELKKSVIGDEGATIDLVHSDLGNIELVPGNFINIGYRIQNPFTMIGNALTAQLFAEQVVCSNGMTLPRKLFGVSLNLRKDYGDESDYFDRFKNGLDKKVGKSYSLDKISEMFSELNTTPVRGMSASRLLNGIKSISTEIAYSIFDISGKEQETEDKRYYSENPMVETENTFFKVLYDLTEQAQKLGWRERLKAEQYSSSIFQLCDKQKLFLN